MLLPISFQIHSLFTPTCSANVAAAHSVLSHILSRHAPGQLIIAEILLEELLIFVHLPPASLTEAIWERAVVDGETRVYFFPHFTFQVHSHFPLTSWFEATHTNTSPKFIMILRLHTDNDVTFTNYFIDYNLIDALEI